VPDTKGIAIKARRNMMPRTNEMSFKMMSFIHETLYGLFRDPYKALHDAGLQTGQTVLEVGCGPGFFTVPAAKIVGDGGSVLALDVNPVAVEHVRRKIQQAGVTNAKVIVANAAQTDLADQSFDLIFVFGFARAVGGIAAIWPELHRLLKPGGSLSIEGRPRPPSRLFEAGQRQGRVAQFKKLG
jgi:ubiquinone/menaquinone biosynthesis C-methylase UbiE